MSPYTLPTTLPKYPIRFFHQIGLLLPYTYIYKKFLKTPREEWKKVTKNWVLNERKVRAGVDEIQLIN